MKNLILLSLISLGICQNSIAQNWSPLPSGDPNFIVDSALQRLVCIPIDSVVEQGTVKTYHVKRDFTVNYDTLTFDKSYFLGYSVSFDTVTGVVQSQADWPYRLEVYAPKDSSWSFNATLTATVDSVVATTTFGQEDSIKYISLDTALSQIILSKVFGIMQFPQLDTAGEAYTLQGVQNQAGVYQPGFDFFYDFDLNDSIQFETLLRKDYNPGYDDYNFSEQVYYKIKVINILESTDSIIYIFNGLSAKYEAVWNDGEREIKTSYSKVDTLRLALKKGGWFTGNHGVFQQYGNEPLLKALGIENQALFNGLYTRFYYDYYGGTNSSKVLRTADQTFSRYKDSERVCYECAFNKINDTLFVELDPETYLGLHINRIIEIQYSEIFHHLIYDLYNSINDDEFSMYIKASDVKGDKRGKFSPNSEFMPTSVAPVNEAIHFSVFNEGGFLNISSAHRMKEISLINIQGQRLAQKNLQNPNQTQLQLSNIPTGIYLVEVVFENGGRGVEKVKV